LNNERKFFSTLAVLALLLLVCMPFILGSPQPLFGQSISVLPMSLFPTLATLGILLFSLVELLRGSEMDDAVRTELPEPIFGMSTLVPLALILLAATSYDILGYLTSTALVVSMLSLAMGNRNPLMLLAVSIVLPMSIYWLITRLFSTYLPTGVVLSDVFS
jgi:putative tricarboxylic transport membrane protein